MVDCMDEDRCVRCGEIVAGNASIGGDRLCHGDFDGTLTCYDVACVLVGRDQDAWPHLKEYWRGVREELARDSERISRKYRFVQPLTPLPLEVIDDVFRILRNG